MKVSKIKKKKNQAKDLKHFQNTGANPSEHRDALKVTGMEKQKNPQKNSSQKPTRGNY